MRAIGLDVGSRTVGVAVSDFTGMIAQPVKTVRRTSFERDLNELVEILRQYEADSIVCGLPYNMNGTEGPSAAAARELGEALAERTGLPLIYQDERMTTVSAQRVLIEGDVSRKKRKEVIDTVAAVFILQAYLDKQR